MSTGVIVGVPRETTAETVQEIHDALKRAFPSVTFGVVGGATSVAFEFAETDTESAA